MLIRPRALPPNARIAVLAPASASEVERIRVAARRIEARGHRVTIAENVGRRYHGYLAGTDEERVDAINDAFQSDDYDAFFFARGGYGVMRILDRIDFESLANNPRPVVGFSDITALHQAMATQGNVAGFHGPMLNSDFYDNLSPEHEQWLWDALSGAAPLTREFSDGDVVCEGEAEGILFGGCLALTTALTGTPYDFWIDGGIWFWEDVEEPVYRLDRMLTHLRLSGRMPQIRGVLIGALKNCGGDAELVAFLREFFRSFDIPVVRNLPFGHHGNNLLMPIGAAVRLSTQEHTFTITEPVVAR